MNDRTASSAALTGAASVNPVAVRLGYAGLIPFVLGAALVWLVREDAHPYVTDGLSRYAAVVISFLGAIHWGLGFRQTVPSPAPFIWGVVPALLAWIASTMPAYAGLVIEGVLLIVCYVVDRRAYPALGASAWLTLRFRLSAVAALSCFIAAQGT
ncbi:DUF3429 domain-containing protein [Mitsuaria sp. GD03876]|uniref:DUF3429 domain-containing protein n=1 Tax=Mitsuaria sp. GD03876 TaxID=2975399 RepID=UPI0024476AC5|nr:DUF3429 domain-containing protein [Mitsuaria sp. GD03876]MDH0863242.1 DUF3429 domain-containing protein [Mitsuaria sp. GD03876]